MEGGQPLLYADDNQLAGFSVSIGDNTTQSDCDMTDYMSNLPPVPPFHRMSLVCGGTMGDRIVIKLPNIVPANPTMPGILAVKVCVARGAAAASLGDATLYLQAPAGYDGTGTTTPPPMMMP